MLRYPIDGYAQRRLAVAVTVVPVTAAVMRWPSPRPTGSPPSPRRHLRARCWHSARPYGSGSSSTALYRRRSPVACSWTYSRVADIAAAVCSASMTSLGPSRSSRQGSYSDATVSPGQRHPRELLTKLLTRLGYQPREDGQSVVLANCPFLLLRAPDTRLVCSINAALAAGYLHGLGLAEDLTARLRPCSVNCCVVLERTA